MAECKHENADHLMAGDWWTCGQRIAPRPVQVEQFRCIDCGAWLPLGPANDDGCDIEIAAARLVAGYVTANDTDDVLADPLAKALLDWQLDECGPMTPEMEQCDALYVDATHGLVAA